MRFEPIRVVGVMKENSKIMVVQPARCEVHFALSEREPPPKWSTMLEAALVGGSAWTVGPGSVVTVQCLVSDLGSKHQWLTNKGGSTNAAFLDEYGDFIEAQRELDEAIDDLGTFDESRTAFGYER